MHATLPLLTSSDFPPLGRGKLQTLQVNLGYLCNQSCLHCHVGAGPNRKEVMDADTMQLVLDYLAVSGVGTLDLTGGAPEMNPHFRKLVSHARALGLHVIDRCNLTILEEDGYRDTVGFIAENHVEVVASLPCYQRDNVDAQRGKGVFEQSLSALRRLNALGYGIEGSGLTLTLVYNPQGASLPPPQRELETAYRRELQLRYGIVFNRLITIANMPIQRFGSTLISNGEFTRYMKLLKGSYRQENLSGVMCRSLLSIDWQGYAYDCDFNQMLGLAMRGTDGRRMHLRDLMGEDVNGRPIVVMDHCYGCTAGQGSGCGGALREEA